MYCCDDPGLEDAHQLRRYFRAEGVQEGLLEALLRLNGVREAASGAGAAAVQAEADAEKGEEYDGMTVLKVSFIGTMPFSSGDEGMSAAARQEVRR